MYFLIYLVKKGDILQKNEIKKILIIRLSALGDSIHTIPLAAALRKQYPTSQLDWIVEDKAAKFIQNNPLLNNVFVLHKKNKSKIQFLKEFISVLNKIKKEKYDVVIDTQQLFKSGFILGLSGGKRKITLDCGREFSFIFANEIIKTGRKQFDINYHVVKRNLEIAKYLGCETSDISFVIPDFSSEYNREIVETINGLDKSKKTFEEIFEILVAKQLGYHDKPIVFLNFDNYYDNMFKMFDTVYEKHFAKEDMKKLYFIANSIDEMFEYIKNYKPCEIALK